MRSTLDIDPHLYCAHWASGRNWQPQAISSWPARLEGQDIFIDFRWAEGNYARLAEFAAELIRLRGRCPRDLRDTVTHLPSVEVDSYNLEIRDDEDFLAIG
jgi:hypothetical protein